MYYVIIMLFYMLCIIHIHTAQCTQYIKHRNLTYLPYDAVLLLFSKWGEMGCCSSEDLIGCTSI